MLIGIEKQQTAATRRERSENAGTSWDVCDKTGSPMYRCESKGAALVMLTKQNVRDGWTVQPTREGNAK